MNDRFQLMKCIQLLVFTHYLFVCYSFTSLLFIVVYMVFNVVYRNIQKDTIPGSKLWIVVYNADVPYYLNAAALSMWYIRFNYHNKALSTELIEWKIKQHSLNMHIFAIILTLLGVMAGVQESLPSRYFKVNSHSTVRSVFTIPLKTFPLHICLDFSTHR